MTRVLPAIMICTLVGVLISTATGAEATATQPARWAEALPLCRMAEEAGESPKTASRKDGSRVSLFNNQIAVSYDESDGTWRAAWPGKVAAAVLGARFSVEVDGNVLGAKGGPAQVAAFKDKLGAGARIRQTWGESVRIERSISVYDDLPAVTISGRITNAGNQEVSLGIARLVDVSEKGNGWWYLGATSENPGAVLGTGTAELQCRPWGLASAEKKDQTYSGTGILTLAGRQPLAGMAFGYLTAREARPDLSAGFRISHGGTFLNADLRFLGRKLGLGESLDLDTAYLSVHSDPWTALERYGDAVAALSELPVRKGANSLWCSWYAHRMAMTEDLVLANAAVAARHFKPLGMDIMQIDHGWQRGDVTGDWVPNERFPHGLKWLSDELKSRFGMKLGVWIAPTDVAETSELFKKHPDWILKDDQGKPRVNWKWYWKPNPNCYELDASNPQAARWIEDTFAQLSAWGVSYFKIDFIASCGGEHFLQHDPKSTRGWSVLRRAMEALRRGAGDDAWIRYCQTPPLLSVGLANSAYGGNDTLDAGLNGKIDVLRENARSLAAGYWLNDRLYHREVCDMSVRMQADIEETRLRLAMMTLAGCSISFSDEFQYLPPSRIHMMQQCLPPGSPMMKPLDLFDRPIPSIWHIHCKNAADEWEIAGLFNFADKPEERTIEFAALGLPADAEVAVFEFWREESLGIHKKGMTLTLPPQTSRILSIRRLTGHPQIIGTDMHVLQGYHEIKESTWDEKTNTLSGKCQRAPGLMGKAFLYVPPGYEPHFDFPLGETSARLTHVSNRIWMQEVTFSEPQYAWKIPFDKVK